MINKEQEHYNERFVREIEVRALIKDLPDNLLNLMIKILRKKKNKSSSRL